MPNAVDALVASTDLTFNIAIANSNPDNTSTPNNQVLEGGRIFRIWVEWWYYGLSAANTNDIVDIYIGKNPGTNFTMPAPGTVGNSNEKRFIFKTWKGLAGNKSLGGTPYSFRGWIKIPKPLQRMGTDDRIVIVARSPTTGQFCKNFIYKWFS